MKAIRLSPRLLSLVDVLVSAPFKDKSLKEKLCSIKNNITTYPICKVCGSDARINTTIVAGWSEYCAGTCGYVDRWETIDSSERKMISDKISNTYHGKSKTEKKYY